MKRKNLLIFLFLFITITLMAEGLEDYITRTFIDAKGNEIVEIKVPGGKPPEGYIRGNGVNVDSLRNFRNIVILENAPSYDWSYGCSATSAAMQAAYYDRTGYENIYNGPTNDGIMPMNNSIWGESGGGEGASGECPLSATHLGYDNRTIYGHADDFWVDYASEDLDPYITGSWDQHELGECTGDFMGTNQSYWGNTDGGTTFYLNNSGAPLHDYSDCESDNPPKKDGCHGLRMFYESRGYAVDINYNQYILGYASETTGYSFEQFMAEIDAGHPLIIHVTGHTMLAIGYNSETEEIYINNTWDYETHTMQWGGSYSDMQHYGVSVAQLAPMQNEDGVPVTFNLFDSYGDGWVLGENTNYISINDEYITLYSGAEDHHTIYLEPGTHQYSYTATDGYGAENSWTITLEDGTQIGSGEGGNNGTTDYSISVEEENPDLNPPEDFTATIFSENNTLLNWSEPQGSSADEIFRLDDGTATAQIGFAANPSSILGSSHPNDAVVHKVSWYLTSNAIHTEAVIYIFGLDGSGIPDTSQLLHTSATLSNTDDAWNNYTLPTPVAAPNGFFIGVCTPGIFTALGTDDGIGFPYEFQNGRNWGIEDWTVSNEWLDIGPAGYPFNMLIRAVGVDNGPLRLGNIAPNSSLSSNNNIIGSMLDSPVYTEISYRNLQGYNIYRNGSIINSGLVSSTTYNDYNLANGIYYYNVTAVYSNGESDPTNTEVIVIQTSEDLLPPTNLAVEVNENESIFSWNAPGIGENFSDDFEGYEDFVIEYDPWTLVDVEGSTTYGFTGITFPHSEEAMSFIVFNPSTTEPTVDGMVAHSGDKFAACFASTTPDNDDWMISPMVTITAGDMVNFWAKSFVADYGLERFNVGVSTTGTDPSNFTIISGASYNEASADDWEEFSFNLSSYAGQSVYVGIQCISSDAFIFMVDDVTIGSAPAFTNFNANTDVVGSVTRSVVESKSIYTATTLSPSNVRESRNLTGSKLENSIIVENHQYTITESRITLDDNLIVERNVESYDVYLDDNYEGSTTNLNWSFIGLNDGQTYDAGVKAIYTDGMSEMVSVSFVYSGVSDFMYGNINYEEDDFVNAYDAALTLQYSVELDPLPEVDPLPWEVNRFIAADVDGNDEIQAFDATLILQYAIGLIDVFPAEGQNVMADEKITEKSIPEINISVVENNLIFSCTEELLAFNLKIDPEMMTVGQAQILNWENSILALNETNTYALGIAAANPIAANQEFLKIPFSEVNSSEITFEVIANTTAQIITLPLDSDEELVLADAYKGNYPNPFNPTTTIAYSLANEAKVEISIYNVKGQKINTLVNKIIPAGEHAIIWDGTNKNNHKISSGVYFCKMTIGNKQFVDKMILMK